MNEPQRTYIAIDLKSFYASIECVERGLNPLTTNLVVADQSRTDKTICLAVSPSLKAYGIPGRPRLFEVVQRVKEINDQTTKRPNNQTTKQLTYIVAPPRMSLYIEYSTRIHNIYLRYIAPEDIHTYSIDEVLIDATDYLPLYHITARKLTMRIIGDILADTGITATAGIGTNLYLCKVAMDIVAKHLPPDKDGVRIAELDEISYRRQLWSHQPITDFWRVGPGIAQRLTPYGIDTMGKIARASLTQEELFYKLFGVNAELLIDHAWGWEPCTMAAIKAYRPEARSLGHGQVLSEPTKPATARIIVQEMAEGIALELADKQMVASQILLDIAYDRQSLTRKDITYNGALHVDRYHRLVPKHGSGRQQLATPTSSAQALREATLQAFDRAVNNNLLIRRLTLTAANVQPEQQQPATAPVQLNLFDSTPAEPQAQSNQATKQPDDQTVKRLQQAMIALRKRYGKNSILKGINFEKGATARERNQQIGGHKG